MEQQKELGLIPAMAKTLVGGLNSESFCERMFSAGKIVTHQKAASTSDTLVEKLTLLRVNKKFMRFMRANHPEVAQEKVPGGSIAAGIRLPKQPSRRVGEKRSASAD